jgi:hypothetical protein
LSIGSSIARAPRSRRSCSAIICPSSGSYGTISASAYSAQPSTLTELNANSVRASEMPRSTIAVNCNSWPGRPSCADSVHAADSKLKSSYCSDEPSGFGTATGSTNCPCCPVLPTSGAGRKCGAGCAADSASLPRRITIGRFGTSTMPRLRMIGSIASITVR